ncbi:MAG TPA: hypothetical protein VLS48_05815, partial [Anaerolineales bacterium]|nr:hypothetical protein [Anaerolineales bacterium]
MTSNSLASMADAIQIVYPVFDRQRFLTLILENEQWEDMALMARMHHVTRSLGATLPQDYPQAVAIIRAAAP